MTVRELIRQLEGCDPDREVYCQDEHEDDVSFSVYKVDADGTARWPAEGVDWGGKWYRHDEEQNRVSGVVMLYG